MMMLTGTRVPLMTAVGAAGEPGHFDIWMRRQEFAAQNDIGQRIRRKRFGGCALGQQMVRGFRQLDNRHGAPLVKDYTSEGAGRRLAGRGYWMQVICVGQ